MRESAPTISAGIISADLMCLGAQIALLEQAGIKALHFDVMDGCFTPMLTVGPPFIKSIKSNLIKDVHLMIEEPDEKAVEYINAGADCITVHLEGVGQNCAALLEELGEMDNVNDARRGLVRGVAINPGTPVERLEPLLENLEMVTLLAVDPVAGKHPTMEQTRQRAAEVKEMLAGTKKDILWCIDGGVKRDNCAEYAAMGADIFVSGSALFAGGAIAENAEAMLAAMRL